MNIKSIRLVTSVLFSSGYRIFFQINGNDIFPPIIDQGNYMDCLSAFLCDFFSELVCIVKMLTCNYRTPESESEKFSTPVPSFGICQLIV